MYFVRGGIFTDTTFTKLESKEERYGPFATYAEARAKWQGQMGWNIDICCHRLFIEKTP